MNGTTPDSLFPASLISPAVAAALPEGYTIRPLQRDDYAAGFLDVLRVLTTVGEISQADFEARFDDMKQTPGRGPVGSHVLVILDGEGKVVGTGALLVERKLYVLCALALCLDYGERSLECIAEEGPHANHRNPQRPQPRPRRSHRGHRRRKRSTGKEARSAHHPGIGLPVRARRLLQGHSGLFRGKRGLLRQVRIQKSWAGNGTLL
jgi:hypothetical protein